MSNSNLALSLTLYTNFSRLELTEPKSAKIEIISKYEEFMLIT